MHAIPPRNSAGAGSVPGLFGGEVYTPAELAKALKVSTNTIRRLFQDEVGVIKFGEANPRGRRAYQTLRIPRAVAERIIKERSL